MVFPRAALAALLAVCGGACASGESSSDGGPPRADAMPLADSGPLLPDGGGGTDPDAGDPGDPEVPVLNELVAQHTGTDSCELVEIFGTAATDYGAYSVVVLESDATPDPGVIEKVFAVGTTDADGLWVTATLPQDSIENGSSSFLLVRDFTGAVDDDLDDNDDGVFDTEPWAALVDSVSIDDGTAGDPAYGVPALAADFDGGAVSVGGMSRVPDGTDTDGAGDWVRNAFNADGLPGCDAGDAASGEALNTPGAPNTVHL